MAHFNFDSYLEAYKIKLSPKARVFCKLGLQRMAKSIDPLHNHMHVVCLLHNLGELLKREKNLGNINFDVLLISIIWHDIWRARHFYRNPATLLWQNLYEGVGSSLIAKKEMTKAGLPDNTIKKVAYAIRKHAEFQILKRKTTESKLLADVDELGRWDIKRSRYAESVLIDAKKPNFKLLKLAEWYFDHFMRPANADGLYFSWSKKEFRKLKRNYIKEVSANVKSKYLKLYETYTKNRKP